MQGGGRRGRRSARPLAPLCWGGGQVRCGPLTAALRREQKMPGSCCWGLDGFAAGAGPCGWIWATWPLCVEWDLSGKCLGSPLKGPACAEGRARGTDPSHPDPSACSSRTWSREPSAEPHPCPARVSARCIRCKTWDTAAPRGSLQERCVTHGVCGSVPPIPHWDGPTWTGPLTREGPAGWAANQKGPAWVRRAQPPPPWGLSPAPAPGAQPWLGGTSSSRGSP